MGSRNRKRNRESAPAPAEPAGLAQLRREFDRASRRLQEQFGAFDGPGRLYDGFFDRYEQPFDRGGTGYGVGIPADRAQDKSHAPLPYLTEPEWRLHLALARDLLARNHLAIGLRDLVTAFIGSVGVQFVRKGHAPGAAASGPVDADGDGEPDADEWVTAAAAAWEEFCEANDWGQGETDREEECRRRLVSEGNSILEFFKGDRGEVPQCRHVEPELVRSPTETPDGYEWATADDWRWGRLTRPNDAEMVLAIYVAHPDGINGRVVKADRFVASKVNADRSVKCGLSDFFPVAGLVRKLAQLEHSLAHVAKVQADIAWWEKTSGTETQARTPIEAGRAYSQINYGGSTQGSAARATDVSHSEPGTVWHTEKDRDVLPGPVAQPGGFVQVDETVLKACAFRFGIPKNFVGGDSGSFAEALASGSPFSRVFKDRQKKQEGFTRAVVKRVLRLCEESGRLKRGTCDRVKTVLTSTPINVADEEKQARTDISKLDKGLADPYKLIKKWGDEPKVLLANLASFKRKLAEQDAQGQPPPGGGGAPPAGGSPAPLDPSSTPPGSAGGDGSSPNAPEGDPTTADSLLRENFTGIDGNGHHWQDGKQVAAPKDGGGAKPGAKPTAKAAAAPSVKKLAADPLADKNHLNALAAAAPTPEARDALETAAWNVPGDKREIDPEDRRRHTLERLGAAWRDEADAGRDESAAHVLAVAVRFGGRAHGPAAGEEIPFDPATYGGPGERPVNAFTGAPVRVVRQPLVGPDGEVAVKGVVEPAGKRESVAREELDTPPFPGAVFDQAAHRWKNPHTGELHGEPAKAATPPANTSGGPSPELHATAAALVAKSDLPPEQAAEYAGYMAGALHQLPAGARAKALDMLARTKATFYPDLAAVKSAWEVADKKKLPKGDEVAGHVGYVEAPSGRVGKLELHLDGAGAGETAAWVYGHELGHLADLEGGVNGDARHTADPVWKKAWEAEIKNGMGPKKLTSYARESAAEGWAELHAHIARVGVADARKLWPRSVKFLESKGML